MAGNAQERTESATPRRRQEARREGTVAKSVDLNTAAVFIGLALFLPALAATLGAALLQSMRTGLNVPQSFSLRGVAEHFFAVLGPLASSLIPLLLISVSAGILINVAQVGFVASGKALTPQFQRINPLEGAKRLFSTRSMFELTKTLAKLGLVCYISYASVAARWSEMLGLSQLSAKGASVWIGQLLGGILLRIAFAWLVLGIIDYVFQRRQVEKQLMMTKDEVRREMKEQETSPELRAELQRRRRRLAKQRMMQSIANADAIITNPIEYAVAVRYDQSKMQAPVVVAKGRHLMAERIRDEAKKHRVAIIPNPPLARSLYAQVEIGDAIPTALFQAVAEVLAYVYSLKRR